MKLAIQTRDKCPHLDKTGLGAGQSYLAHYSISEKCSGYYTEQSSYKDDITI